MKNKFVLFFSLLTLLISGCTSGNNNSDSYLDKQAFKDGDIEYVFANPSETILSSYNSLGITLSFTNRNPAPVIITLKDAKIIRESNGAEYGDKSSIMPVKRFNLECDVTNEATYIFNTPTSYKEDNYTFYLNIGSNTFKYHLYKAPAGLVKSIEVSLVVDGKSARKELFVEGEKLQLSSWISNDMIYYCNEWYLDSQLKNPVAQGTLVMESMTLYGKSETILKWSTPDSISSSYVIGYNFIPESGEIVVPANYAYKQVRTILAGAFHGNCEGLKAIYIPKTVGISASHNFSSCKDLEYVYFGGTEQEWAEKNEATFPSKTKIVFNTYYR